MRHREGDAKTTALIFRSGKVVITGSKSEEGAHTAAKKYAKIIKKVIGNKVVEMEGFKIHNVVATYDYGF